MLFSILYMKLLCCSFQHKIFQLKCQVKFVFVQVGLDWSMQWRSGIICCFLIEKVMHVLRKTLSSYARLGHFHLENFGYLNWFSFVWYWVISLRKFGRGEKMRNKIRGSTLADWRHRMGHRLTGRQMGCTSTTGLLCAARRAVHLSYGPFKTEELLARSKGKALRHAYYFATRLQMGAA